MTKDTLTEEISKWNICPDRGWAELIANAIDKGYLWDQSNTYAMREDQKSPEDVRMMLCSDRMYGPFAWVDSKGRVLPVPLGGHDRLAEIILGPVPEVERTHARVSSHTKTVYKAIQYVDKRYQTDDMLIATHNCIKGMGY